MVDNPGSDRRAFLKTGALAGAALVAGAPGAVAQVTSSAKARISRGDAAILRFLAAAEAYRNPGPARAAWAIVAALALAGVLMGSARAETEAVQTGAVAGAVPPPLHEAPAASILAALERTKQYPDAAYTSHRALDGRTIVSFDIDDDGHPQNIEFVHRSGNAAFDRQTVESVRAAVCAECRGKAYRITYDYHLP